MESFGIVLVEAIYFGNYIISTNTGIASEVTKNGTIGKLIENNNAIQLNKEILDIINGVNKIDKYYSEIRELCEQEFLWDKIVKKIYNYLYKD